MPLQLQKWLSPVESLYVTAALSKLLMQFALIFLLSIYICRHFRFCQVDFLAIFLFDDNTCEKTILEKLAKTQENQFALPPDCTFFSWDTNESPELLKMQSQLLKYWNITTEEVHLFREK